MILMMMPTHDFMIFMILMMMLTHEACVTSNIGCSVHRVFSKLRELNHWGANPVIKWLKL